MMPSDAEKFSGLISCIYDAALDTELWPEVLKITCEYTNGATGTLMSQETAPGSAHFYFQWGNDEKFLRSYQETYVKLNPVLVSTLLAAKAGDVLSTIDLIPLNEFFASRFYKEWVAPQGFVDSAFITIDKTATGYGFVAITRYNHQSLVDDEMRSRMRLLAPHFMRSVAIGKVVQLHRVEAAAFADTLDGLASAMFLVDAAERVVHSNLAGQQMLAEASVVHVYSGKFAVVDAGANQALHHAIISAEGGDRAVNTRGIAVPFIARDAEQYIAHVLPLTSGARRTAGIAYSAVAAVFVRKMAFMAPHPLEALAKAYQLTPAETRVLMMIVEIGGVPDVAPVLGISETTVKTHLQRIFQKTGTKRQADLVKLVGAFIGPFGTQSA